MPKIKELNIFISDGNYSSKYPKQSEFTETGVPFIRANNMKNQTIMDDDMYHISSEKHEELKKGHLKSGDVLIVTRGSIGLTAIVPEKYDDANINAQIVLLRCDNKTINNKYLLWCLNSKMVKKQIKKMETGSTLKQLPVKKINEIEIPLPEYNVQLKIANDLDVISKAIENRKQSIADCEELIKSKFSEMFGRENLVKVGDKFDVQTGGTPSKKKESYWNEGTIPWIGSNMCTDSVIYANDNKFITEEGLKNSNAKLFPKGTVLIALIGATIGKTALLEIETSTNQNIAGILVTENENYTPEYIFYCMRNNYHFFERMGKGFNMANLKTIRNLTFPDAELEKQKEFSSYLKKVEKYKKNLQKDIKDLENLFNNKIQNAFKKTTN